jgi:hypothetical protein
MSTINSKKQLDEFLSKIVSESLSSAARSTYLNYLVEEEEEKKEKKDDTTSSGEKSKEKPEEVDTKSKEAEKKESPAPEPEIIPDPEDVTAEMLKQKLNMIRSGKSLSDATISSEFQEYYNNLTEEERLALWTYLSGLAQILAGAVSGDAATDPEDAEEKIVVEPAHVHKNVVNNDKAVDIEDTMAPIKVVQ